MRTAIHTYPKLLVILALSLLASACDRTGLQPETSRLVFQFGPQVRVAGGFLLSVVEVQQVLTSVTRDVARALRDPGVRSTVYNGLHASPYLEHEVHFRSFLLQEGHPLLEAIAALRRSEPDAVVRTLDSIVDLEFYMPGKKHWAQWKGGDDLLVASDLTDDDEVLPIAFDLDGNAVPWTTGKKDLPQTPTLAVVPSETDFSRVPSLATQGAPRAPMFESGVVMTYAWMPDNKSSGLDGDPEIEIHAFVRDDAGNFVDLQCAGQYQAYPYYYDQNAPTFEGSVQVILEGGIGANPVEFSMWEDDFDRCEPNYGRPPEVTPSTQNDFNNWNPRPVTVVTLSGGIKVISIENLGIPLALADEWRLKNDDPIGELQRPPSASCWPSSGSASYFIYEPSSGHPQNGFAYLDFTFGQRSPVCPTNPPAVSITGPTLVPTGSLCEWQAVVTGGEAPYTYTWTGVLSGSGPTLTGSPTESGLLRVDVIAADGQYAFDYHSITVSESAPPCEP